MHLDHDDDQRALRDGAERFLKDRYTAAARKVPGSMWSTFAEMGWLGLILPDRFAGGIGCTIIEAAILAEVFGRHQVSEPFVSCGVLAGGLIARSGSRDALVDALPPLLISGQRRFAVAHEERGRGLAAADIETQAVGLTLSGRKTIVLDAALADAYLVTARSGSGVVHCYLVSSGAAGLTTEYYPTVDGRTAATLTFNGAQAERLGDAADDGEMIDLVIDQAIATLCSDMVGAMQGALHATVAYAKMRVQFGQPIGANQVVKHRLVEMAIRCEEARSMALLAAIRTSDESPTRMRARAVSSAKVKISKMARAVTEDAVQLHGAMGVTDELDVGGYLKRTLAFEAVLGTSRFHKTRYAATREEQSS